MTTLVTDAPLADKEVEFDGEFDTKTCALVPNRLWTGTAGAVTFRWLRER